VVTTFVPSPVTGAKRYTDYTHVSFPLDGTSNVASASNQNWSAMLPQLHFPVFDGSGPKIWKKRCENFFGIYVVPSAMWVKSATMYFSGSAAFWLQAIDVALVESSWCDFCLVVYKRFEREQHSQLIRQFFHVKQFGSVVEYVEQFDSLVHQLLAHD
jgi:hypothetical protein